ncbi:alpha/beta hydrolase [Sphingomonas corticis]|uniref:Alpha/beta hydrolase n=1 Tax=Sphingomonas corticis TaxID=2722791 RepID=A0ABX1CPY5_9SPHN|nr:alpha/beta hydrolase [Sphingomonas corticis]NJR80010.1 alpha/beta hydrolase [Sphingomonas corticis]
MTGIDTHFQRMLAEEAEIARKQPRLPVGGLPVQMVRAGYKARRHQQDLSPPDDVDALDLQVLGGAGHRPARLYTPRTAEPRSALLVYFHGGGFVLGDLDTHDGHCRRLAAGADLRVLAIDYRLAPENPFPAAHDDALAATLWAFEHAADLGADPTLIAVGGDSAGGNLAASVACSLDEERGCRLALQLLLYPVIWPEEETASRRDLDGPVLTRDALAWFDACLAARGHAQSGRALLGGRTSRTPALVVTAGHDPLKDEGRAFAEHLARTGVAVEHVEFPAMIHDFFLMPDVSPAVGTVVSETTEALRRALARPHTGSDR